MMEPALRRISLAALEAAMQDAAQVDKMIKGLRARACRRRVGRHAAAGPERRGADRASHEHGYEHGNQMDIDT
jgi:hypothetical protein